MKKTTYFSFFIMAVTLCTMMFTSSSCSGDDNEPLNPPPYNGPDTTSVKEDDTPQGVFQVKETCNHCEGTKICSDCHGSRMGCYHCGGTGHFCSACGTTGKCKECDGRKRCTECNGTGVEICNSCRGIGVCSYCNGVGSVLGIQCPRCNGSTKCPKCYGTGKTGKLCGLCGGLKVCYKCGGSGICTTCYGTPTCSICGGDGHCMSCGGTGVCHICEGTGERDLKSHNFDADGEELTVFIHCASEWYAQTEADWIQLSQSYGAGNCTLTITVPENPSIERREGVINFISGNSTITVEVGQFAQAIKLDVEPSTIYVQCYGSGEDIHVESNTSWTITAADPWITCSPSSGNGNATIKVSASGYYEGTRYTTLTFTDASGEITKEVVAAQALYRGAEKQLKNMFEKPFGTVEVNLPTASYWDIKSAIEKTYKTGSVYSSTIYQSYSFSTYRYDNSSLDDWTYMGLQLYSLEVGYNVSDYSSTPTTVSVEYSFHVDKDKLTTDYKNYLNNILQDFKYNLGITLKKFDTTYDFYTAFDDKKNEYLVSVYDRDTYYVFNVEAVYSK